MYVRVVTAATVVMLAGTACEGAGHPSATTTPAEGELARKVLADNPNADLAFVIKRGRSACEDLTNGETEGLEMQLITNDDFEYETILCPDELDVALDRLPAWAKACPGERSVEVVYFTDGTARTASITSQRQTGISQQADTFVPLTSKDGRLGLHPGCFIEGDFLYISAQNNGASGTISCSIEVDGEVISTNSSSGGYAIASCEGEA